MEKVEKKPPSAGRLRGPVNEETSRKYSEHPQALCKPAVEAEELQKKVDITVECMEAWSQILPTE